MFAFETETFPVKAFKRIFGGGSGDVHSLVNELKTTVNVNLFFGKKTETQKCIYITFNHPNWG
jgi:hypothetical protein